MKKKQVLKKHDWWLCKREYDKHGQKPIAVILELKNATEPEAFAWLEKSLDDLEIFHTGSPVDEELFCKEGNEYWMQKASNNYDLSYYEWQVPN